MVCLFVFFKDTATTEIYTYVHTLSLHDALPISHMHLLEACLALHEATKETAYLDRAGLLLDLFRDRFLVTGSLREFFTDDLRPAPGDAGRIVEPGHHRSEEHTSELQSLMCISYAVFCLKKKT